MSTVSTIIERQHCNRHHAKIGFACWDIHTATGSILSAVCDRRAKAAGFIGKISDSALRKVTKK